MRDRHDPLVHHGGGTRRPAADPADPRRNPRHSSSDAPSGGPRRTTRSHVQALARASDDLSLWLRRPPVAPSNISITERPPVGLSGLLTLTPSAPCQIITTYILLGLRARQRWTQEQLARAIGVAGKAVIYQWESRRRKPSAALWRRVSFWRFHPSILVLPSTKSQAVSNVLNALQTHRPKRQNSISALSAGSSRGLHSAYQIAGICRYSWFQASAPGSSFERCPRPA